MTMAQQSFPHPEREDAIVKWNGSSFEFDGRQERVLEYPVGASGWTDELTALHEEVAGEGTHYIDVASRRLALSEVKRVLGSKDGRVMEVGVSSGYMLRDLIAASKKWCVVGADYTLQTLKKLGQKTPDVPLVRLDITNAALPSGAFDVIVALNVLEHIEDDRAALREMARLLDVGGALVLEVPAGPDLFDQYDEELMHFRRYTMKDLREKVQGAGLVVEKASHLGALIFPAFWMVKKLNRKKKSGAAPAKDVVAKGIATSGGMTGVGTLIMRLEEIARALVYLPAGIRCTLTARKRG